MKSLMMISAAAAIALSPAAFAQNQPPKSPTAQQPATNQNAAAAQQIQQDLKKAGFTDVKVVAESFVVQAKTKDGNPVVMTIGPHGMSAFEAMKAGPGSNSQSDTTGQAGSGSTKF